MLLQYNIMQMVVKINEKEIQFYHIATQHINDVKWEQYLV